MAVAAHAGHQASLRSRHDRCETRRIPDSPAYMLCIDLISQVPAAGGWYAQRFPRDSHLCQLVDIVNIPVLIRRSHRVDMSSLDTGRCVCAGASLLLRREPEKTDNRRFWVRRSPFNLWRGDLYVRKLDRMDDWCQLFPFCSASIKNISGAG